MAEVKKKFSELDPGSVPFNGTETIAAVQGGITKRGTISGIHGAGWWDKLKAGFVDFIAPEALHANDADTLGGETSAELHNAGALIGTAPLSAIPAELTGKNAETATLAADATKLKTARTIGGVLFNGSANINLPGVNTPGNQNTSGNAATAGSASAIYVYSSYTVNPPPGLYFQFSAGTNTINTATYNGSTPVPVLYYAIKMVLVS